MPATDYKSALVTTATWNGWAQAQRDQYGGTRQYTTINSWVAAQQTRDIVTNNENNVLDCYNDFGVGLYEKAVISGFIQGPNNKVVIRAPAGQRHTGKPGTGFRLYHDQVWANVFESQISNFEMHFIECELLAGGGIAMRAEIASDWSNIINACIVSGGDQTVYGKRFLLCNSLLHDCTGKAVDSPAWYGYESINNVFANNATAISASSTDTSKDSGISLSNCVFFGNTTDQVAGLNYYAADTNTNASDKSTTPPGAGSIANVVAGDFVDAAGNDFHINTGSALYQKGTDYSAKFSNDVDDEAWVVPWSIGFDQPAAGGGQTLLDGSSAAAATAAAGINAAIPLSGASSTIATGSAAISAGIDLAGISAGISGAAGAVDAAVSFSASAIAQSIANAGLDLSALLQGGSAAQAAGTGDLTAASGNTELAGVGRGNAVAAGEIILQATLSGTAIAESLAQAGISTGQSLGGAASSAASAGGSLIQDVPLAGAARAVVSGAGNISAMLPLSASAASAANAAGGLTVSVAMSAAALARAFAQAGLATDSSTALAGAGDAQASGAGALQINVPLSAVALARAAAAGNLAVGVSSIGYQQRWSAAAKKRRYTVSA